MLAGLVAWRASMKDEKAAAHEAAVVDGLERRGKTSSVRQLQGVLARMVKGAACAGLISWQCCAPGPRCSQELGILARL